MLAASIAILDDEWQIVDQLRLYLDQMYKAHELEYPVAVDTFTSAEDFRREAEQKAYDLLIVDIFLNAGVDGLELARQVMENHADTDVIIISGYIEQLQQSWDKAALGFLYKPITYDLFKGAINYWQKRIRQRFNHFTFHSNGKKIMINLSELLYIEARDKALFVITRSKEKYKFYGQMKHIEAQLATFNFIRCHRSYLINIQYLKEVNQRNNCGEVVLMFSDQSTISIPISVRKKRDIIMAYNSYLEVGCV